MADTKKYGLIIKKKTTEKPLKKSSVFGNDSSDEEEVPKSTVNISLLREARKKKEMKQTQIEIEKALKEDPNVYEYDNIYDKMVEKKKAAIPKLAEKNKKPKYIQGLLESAKSRKMEEERRMERKIQKEREQEGGEFQDKEEFVTSAYRKRMLELQEEDKLLKKQEALDAANDVSKKSDLTMFYSNLLRQNVSMGGCFTMDNQTEKDKDNLDEDDKEKDKDIKEDVPSRNISEQSKHARKDSEHSRRDREGRYSNPSRRRDSDRRHTEHETRRSSTEERSDPKDNDKERNYRQKESRNISEKSSHRPSENRRGSNNPDKPARAKDEIHRSSGENSDEKRKLPEKTEKSEPECATSSKFAKRSNNEAVSSARERFLERKRAREMQKPQDDNSDED